MADEHIRTPSEPVRPGAPPPGDRVAPGAPPGGLPKDRVAPGPAPAVPPAPLAASAAAAPRQAARPHPAEPKDSFREVVETVVFVVVLVLLLKSFVAEAFVIPTGSMAPTLYGYHRMVTCPQCKHQFAVNVSKEVEGDQNERQPVTGCTCPNCMLHIELTPRGVEGKAEP